MIPWAEREARRIAKARTLLEPAVENAGGTWADLGCGEGIFTYLLCMLLRPGSRIYAVDKQANALRALGRHLAESCNRAPIEPVQADFTGPLNLPALDGLVLANSLHFVSHKQPVLARLLPLLKPGGRLVVIEYNARRGNFAVPYPMDETGFLKLAVEVGLEKPEILVKVPSSFLGEMYTGRASVRRK